MEIWTRRRDHEAAERVYKELFGDAYEEQTHDKASDSQIPEPSSADVEANCSPGRAGRREELGTAYFDSSDPAPAEPLLFPEDATAEVWSGKEVPMAQMLEACLLENGIGCVVDDSDGRHRLRVVPASETRAKEIIREVIEATPPE